jgi:hypothetical protein
MILIKYSSEDIRTRPKLNGETTPHLFIYYLVDILTLLARICYTVFKADDMYYNAGDMLSLNWLGFGETFLG